jgi:Family of unknown function (DUF5427)
MEQVNGGSLIVNRGASDTSTSANEARDLNLVHGLSAASKLARANLDSLVRLGPSSSTPAGHKSPAESGDRTTVCPVYLRLQPALAPLPWSAESTETQRLQAVERASAAAPDEEEDKYLFFLLILVDPANGLRHETLTQALPASWLDIPFEENEWVEQEMVDVIRKGVEVIGQEYISGRQSGRSSVKKSGSVTPSVPEGPHSDATSDAAASARTDVEP